MGRAVKAKFPTITCRKGANAAFFGGSSVDPTTMSSDLHKRAKQSHIFSAARLHDRAGGDRRDDALKPYQIP
jgi:hypothetical protein